jgi:DNA replication and repair protein RecF
MLLIKRLSVSHILYTCKSLLHRTIYDTLCAMYLSRLALINFRNYARLSLDMPRRIMVLQGANAQGKTNVLEAIYYLTAARSPYAGSDTQLVNWLAEQDDLPHARVEAELVRGNALTRIEITLTRDERNHGRYRKHIRINGVDKRVMDLIGVANIVLFMPQDISLVDGSPSGRRHYLDATLCQIDPRYCRALAQYGRVLEQRNGLLRQLRDRGGSPEQLWFWDDRLVEHGAQIIARRQQAILDLEALAQAIHRDLSGGRERLRLRYSPSFDPQHPQEDDQQLRLGLDLPPPISMPQDPETIQEAFRARLRSTQSEEIVRGITLSGPHRDDMLFLNGQIDLRTYGSRGQQRTAVLAIKLAEVALMARLTGEQPILLLDEVMSELDASRRQYLSQQLAQVEQSLVTTTDLDALTPDVLKRAALYSVSQGRLERLGLEG